MHEMITVKDVMIPLDDVPTVSERATLADAMRILDRADRERPPGRPAYRAVLIVNERQEVVGKLGHLAALKALEPGYESPAELATLDRAGVDPDLRGSISAHMRFWHADFPNCCRRAAHTSVRDLMLEVAEHLSESTPISAAIATLVRLNTLSLPVVRGGETVVGLLRLADLYQLVSRTIIDNERRAGATDEE